MPRPFTPETEAVYIARNERIIEYLKTHTRKQTAIKFVLSYARVSQLHRQHRMEQKLVSDKPLLPMDMLREWNRNG